MNKASAIKEINSLAKANTPFLFIADFKCLNNHVIPLDQVNPEEILFDINGFKNFQEGDHLNPPIRLRRHPISSDQYRTKFDKVHHEISIGNTYLLNLTQPTTIETDEGLRDIFQKSKARYKLWFKDEFVVFSPETFIRIADQKMSSFPMKGTIDAKIDRAAEKILSSHKEMAEHATIVDLIRNDMSQFANHVQVVDFRYLEEIKTNEKSLLQVSSKITGDLQSDYLDYLGEIVYSLLPAGSICGAPKQKTLEIIEQVEGYERGYYTGVVGYFDGEVFDSGVMIRFIEKQNDGFVYKSGGGIHFLSECEQEYQEMIDKVYVPVH